LVFWIGIPTFWPKVHIFLYDGVLVEVFLKFFVQSFDFYESFSFRICQECLEFEVGFYEQWGKLLLMGTNFFSDPKGNMINIEFEEGLLAQRQIQVVEKIRSFYNLNNVYYVCTVYCGDRYFRIRVFDLDWTEVEYPGKTKNSLACNPLSSIRFFQAFRVQFIPATVCNINPFLLHLQLHLYGHSF